MVKNRALNEASRAQQDEFYTARYESEFFKYFALFFNVLGLKKLIATCYAGSTIAQQQLSLFDIETPTPNRKPYCAVIESIKDYNCDGRTGILDAEYILQH